jgi:hypothetical protein
MAMEDALLTILSTWKGRQAIQAEFEAGGFFLPRRYQERIIEFCGPNVSNDLARYWDEVAMEWVCSAGKGSPDKRRFMVQPRYRSPYLDELAEKMDFADPHYRNAPIHRCAFEYMKKNHDRDFAFPETAMFESMKEAEIESHRISSAGWGGKKKDIIPFAWQFATKMNFVSKNRRFVKKSAAGLVFEFRVDVGGIPDCTRSLPLLFDVYHESDPDFRYSPVSFDMIIPGFSRYAYCVSPKSYVLGILAHVEFFDLLYNSFQAEPAAAALKSASLTQDSTGSRRARRR